MESSDNKTPSRAATGRPSLLSTAPSNTSDKTSQTSMLASLERDGRTPAAVSAQRTPSRRKAGFAALALVLVGGAGALYAFGPFDDTPASVAVAAPAPAPSAPAAARPASMAVATAASQAASGTAAQIELAAASVAAAAPAAASAATVALAQADGASGPHVNPLDKLAAKDSEPVATPAAVAVVTKDKPPAVAAASTKPHAVAVAAAHPPAVHADAKAAASHKAHRAEDDADTELVAALIARLDKRGAKPPAGPTGVVNEATPASIASRVQHCSTNQDLVEARQCRNKACDGHWGKVDACPAARAPGTSRNDEADHGKRG